MPRGDGTGPGGMGPMTGRGAGYCAGYSAPGYVNPVCGRVAGFGFGRGAGRGFGRGPVRASGPFAGGYLFYGAPFQAPYASGEITPGREADMLKKQAAVLQDELEAVQRRVKELEPVKGSEGSE